MVLPVPLPPATPQARSMPEPTGSAQVPRGRRSFAPGSTLMTMDSPSGPPLSARKSVMPRNSVMPCSKGGIPTAPVQVNPTDFQAKIAENNRLKRQLEHTSERLEEERNVRQKKEDEAIALGKKLNEVESRAAKYQKEAGRNERRVKREEDEKAKGEQDLKRAIDDLQSTLGNVQGDKEQTAAKLDSLRERFVSNEKELNETRAAERHLRSEVEDYKSTNDQLEAQTQVLSDELSDLKSKLSRCEGELQALRSTLADERAESEAHVKDVMDRHSREVELKSDEIEAKTAACLALQKEIAAKTQALEELSGKAAGDAAAAQAEVAERDARLQALTAELETEKTCREQADKTVKELQGKLVEAGEKADMLARSAEDSAAQAVQKAEQVKKDKKETQAVIEGLRTELLASKRETTDASAALRVKEDELKETERGRSALQAEVEELSGELDKLNKSFDLLRTDDAKSMKRVQEKQITLKQSTELLNDRIREMKRKEAKSEAELTKLRAEAKDAQAKIDELASEAETLDDKLADLDYKLRLEEHNVKKTGMISQRLREKLEQRDGEIRSLKTSKKNLVATANDRIDRMNEETKRLETVANQYRAEYELLKARLSRFRKARGGSVLGEDGSADGDRPSDEKDESHDASGDAFDLRRSLPVQRAETAAILDEDEDEEHAEAEAHNQSLEEQPAEMDVDGAADTGATEQDADVEQDPQPCVETGDAPAEQEAQPRVETEVAPVEQEAQPSPDAAEETENVESAEPVRQDEEPKTQPPIEDEQGVSAADEPMQPGASPSDEMTAEQLEALDFASVKQVAKKHGLKLNGGKKQLIARILSASAGEV
ncbi:hypothetical protein DIPPA_08579 [Diplonema papillatum]|nr:hypothetical protein DIPPA_08579 [Diplonema papillatum]